jgi:hypothetical protein
MDVGRLIEFCIIVVAKLYPNCRQFLNASNAIKTAKLME